jgi:hypothetical protein
MLVPLITALPLVLTGCGSSAPSTPVQPVTVTATSTVTETVSAVPTKTSAAPAAAASTPSIAPPADSSITVPDGIGLNYQEAQDRWRAAGLHVAPATDATGANRLPVRDSNWVVVGRYLKPGSQVAGDSFITATVKKYTDD